MILEPDCSAPISNKEAYLLFMSRHGLFKNMNITTCLADGYLKCTAYMYFSFLVIIGMAYCFWMLLSSMFFPVFDKYNKWL